MIAYFDTSAVIPLIIDEPSTPRCNQVWNEASRVLSVRLLYPEARAALARAHRMGHVTRAQVSRFVEELDDLMSDLDHVELTAQLAHTAGEHAQTHDLRGYDAVHLAAAESVLDDELVLVTGDGNLAAAGSRLGIAVAVTTVEI